MVVQYKRSFLKYLRNLFGKSPGNVAFNIILYIFFFGFGLATLYPFLHVVGISLETIQLIDGVPTTIYNLSAYIFVLQNREILNSFFLSIGVVGAHVFLQLFLTLLTAYPLSKKYLKGRTPVMLFILFTMLFSGGLIPSYILITQVLGWQDNVLVYIVPGVLGGFNIFVTKAFLQTIPESLEEAAKIDGANHFFILFRIYLPLSLPIMATVGLWAGVGRWNNWMTGVLYITTRDLLIMQNILRDMLSFSPPDIGGDNPLFNLGDSLKMATVVIGTLPIIMIYPFVQKYFVKGMLLGSVKG